MGSDADMGKTEGCGTKWECFFDVGYPLRGGTESREGFEIVQHYRRFEYSVVKTGKVEKVDLQINCLKMFSSSMVTPCHSP